ncbi:RbsD or FucU transport [Rubrobacter xylanophilus DSM 9941]|uniref:D-ribose pyranase 2 n=1 Tax=Rubrobacter xylanophilus (strain DSM 9941 / JCM 11954 / NBRC 16129 / PRD-1) TaxID=266117 RepID=RBSD2_RUBXD|nr:D-ribose pyranase [Rubrobacter xylanophilus]Q1AUT6.1 RecName: Full=D-ribose pyranase 2 [Rubrobacter xylanophilus DSM 9941]ABG04842.1 RbsD or FucU transport [Rubrobacter xylanophilus DSM 9941]
MKRSGILNQPLSNILASFGHTDLLVVCDAGFPIPRDAQRVDLAIAPDLPDLRTVLSLINEEFITEKVVIAEEMAEFNPPLHGWLQKHFSGVEFERRPHEEMLTQVATSAKAIVRTGAFDPWGNIGLVSGVDVERFFAKEGTVLPDYYRDRAGEA